MNTDVTENSGWRHDIKPLAVTFLKALGMGGVFWALTDLIIWGASQ